MSSPTNDRLEALRTEYKACLEASTDMCKTSAERIAAMNRLPKLSAEIHAMHSETGAALVNGATTTLAAIDVQLRETLELRRDPPGR